MDELPCRFCGKTPVIKSKIIDREWGGPSCYAVVCLDHKWNNTGWRATKAGAIVRWNKLQVEGNE